MMGTDTIDSILSKLEKVKRSGNGWVACCPAHEDHSPSLSITHRDGRILVSCKAGCATEDVVQALDLRMADLFDEPLAENRSSIAATYDYVDEDGTVLYQVVRMVPKSFRQRRPDGAGDWVWSLGDTRRVLFNLPTVLKQVEAGRRVLIVEGEKDVLRLKGLGFVATTNAGGAGTWRTEYSECLAGAHVAIIPDNDEPGRKHAEVVQTALMGIAKSVKVVTLPGLEEKGDVSDWIAAGGTADQLKEIIRAPEEVVCNNLLATANTKDMLHVIRETGRYKTEKIAPGVDYPWRSIQKLTRGLRPGWFCIMAGYPGSGKTAAALDIAFHAAKNNKRILLNSLEMDEEEVALRMIQRWGLDTERLYEGKVNQQDCDAFDEAEQFYEYANILYAAERNMDALSALVVETQPDLLIVDYIGLMDMGNLSEYEGTTKHSRALVALARTHKIPVLCLSQLTRPQDKTKVAVPTIFALRGTGALEADAHQILFTHRNQSEDTHTFVSEGQFIVAKARMGRTGAMPYRFNGETQVFMALDNTREQGFSNYNYG